MTEQEKELIIRLMSHNEIAYINQVYYDRLYQRMHESFCTKNNAFKYKGETYVVYHHYTSVGKMAEFVVQKLSILESPDYIPDQFFKNGETVLFNNEDWPYTSPDELDDESELMDQIAKSYGGQTCTIDCLATASELGNKEYGYYDVTFGDGTELLAISGYHLEKI